MRRRDFVKAMVAASVSTRAMLGQQASAVPASPAPASVTPSVPTPAPPPAAPGPVPWMHGLLEVKPLPMTPLVPDAVAATNAHFFTERQMATLRRLSELLLPPIRGYPGALDVGTPEFLDFLIGASPAGRQQLYQSGLDRLEAEAVQHFGQSFAAVENQQADQLIRPWLRTWMTDHPPTEAFADFINVAHDDIRTATINSREWDEAATARHGGREPNEGLYWYPVDPDLYRENSAPASLVPARGMHPKERRS